MPVMVPPVPTPDTTTSTPPSVSFQIRAVGEDQGCAKRAQDPAPLNRKRLRHNQRDGIATRGSYEGERDTSVAAGGLDQFFTRPQNAALLGVPDHGSADAVFY